MRGAGWRRNHEGMLELWARLDPHTGAQIEAMPERLRRELWNDDKAVPCGRRTPAQRDADALAYALAGITGSDADAHAVDRLHARTRREGHATADQPGADELALDGRHGGCDPLRRLPPAQISILIGLEALHLQTGEMGLTDAGTELPPEIVRQHACDAHIIPMILNSPGGPVDVGRACRTVPLRLRRLLVARDRHCKWRGCHEPPSRCDSHHIIYWVDGGPTNLDNLVLLCHRHHHHLHQYGYRLVPQPDGTWSPTQEPKPKPAPQRSTRQPRAP